VFAPLIQVYTARNEPIVEARYCGFSVVQSMRRECPANLYLPHPRPLRRQDKWGRQFHVLDTWSDVLCPTGDPQEECVRCGKVYLTSSNQVAHGFCGSCYTANQGLPLIKESSPSSLRSCGDSGSEESCTTGTERDEEDSHLEWSKVVITGKLCFTRCELGAVAHEKHKPWLAKWRSSNADHRKKASIRSDTQILACKLKKTILSKKNLQLQRYTMNTFWYSNLWRRF
jgi:hypothetical protein